MGMTTRQGITLTTTPVQGDIADDDAIAFRDCDIFVQSAGTIVICKDADSYASGARKVVVAGEILSGNDLQGDEDIFLASPDSVEIDIIEWGVNG